MLKPRPKKKQRKSPKQPRLRVAAPWEMRPGEQTLGWMLLPIEAPTEDSEARERIKRLSAAFAQAFKRGSRKTGRGTNLQRPGGAGGGGLVGNLVPGAAGTFGAPGTTTITRPFGGGLGGGGLIGL